MKKTIMVVLAILSWLVTLVLSQVFGKSFLLPIFLLVVIILIKDQWGKKFVVSGAFLRYFLIALALTLLDVLSTYIGIVYLDLREFNPLAHYLIVHLDVFAFPLIWIVALGVYTLSIQILLRRKMPYLIWTLLGIHGVVVLGNIIQIIS